MFKTLFHRILCLENFIIQNSLIYLGKVNVKYGNLVFKKSDYKTFARIKVMDSYV